MNKNVHVKPVDPNKDSGYFVFRFNVFENLADDWKRYGFRVAIKNLCVLVMGDFYA